MTTAAARPLTKDRLTGAQKTAVLCIALGPKGAAPLLQRLTPDEVELVGREIAGLKTVEADLINAVLQEFQNATRLSEPTSRGGMPYAQQVLEEALGSKANPMLYKIREQTAGTGLTQLKRAAPEVLAGLVRGEHPQTIALILAHLDPRQASALVEHLDPELAANVLYRVARMGKISPDMIAAVETALSSKTDLSLSQEMTISGGPAAAAKVLNRVGGGLDKQLLESIGGMDAEIAAQITARLFVFEDLLMLDGKAMQRVLREAETKQLALALKAASPELLQHIKANMSERAAGALDEEIDLLGPARVRDVEAAQARVLESVRALEEAGEILLHRPGGSDDIIA